MGEFNEFAIAAANHLDEHNGLSAHEQAMRIMKVQEEAGEVAQAWIGVQGQNPRKGVTHTLDDVALELADVALTVFVALASLGFDAEREISARMSFVQKRWEGQE